MGAPEVGRQAGAGPIGRAARGWGEHYPRRLRCGERIGLAAPPPARLV